MKANELFPELEEEIDRNQSDPLGLWNDLFFRLVRAYETKPINDDLIRKIYDYAAWCFNQPPTDDAETDLANAVAIGLMENVPLDKAVSEDLYRWLSIETFRGCERLFRHHLSDEDYQRFSDEFTRKKQGFSGKPRL